MAGVVFGVLVIALLGAMASAVVFHGTAGGTMPAPLAFMLLLMHALAAVAGGYLGAAIARRRPAAHGLAVGVLYLLAAQVAPGLPAHLMPAPVVRPLWLTAAGMAAGLAGAVLGGVARAQAEREHHPAAG